MCGVFAISGVDPSLGELLFARNRIRGRDAWGVWTPEGGAVRRVGPFSREDASMVPGCHSSMLGNLRAEPTTEWVKNMQVSDVQPYTVGKWTIVHNGTIANDKELCESFGLKPLTRIDSWVIAALCDKLGSFARAVECLVGSYAILAVNADDPSMVHFACNYRPLYFTAMNDFAGTCCLSSVPFTDSRLIEPYSLGYMQAYNGKSILRRRSLYPINEKPFQRALVVFSGGLDSTVAAAKLKRDGYAVELLHYAYGARAQGPERQAVEAVAKHLDVPLHVVDTPIFTDVIKGSRLTNTKDTSTAPGEVGAEYAHEWVPARNLIMTSIALGIAEARGFGVLALGANLEEAGAYPDNEPEFLNQFNKIIPFAVADGKQIHIETPVGNLMKHEIVKLGLEINAPMHLSWSCYNAFVADSNGEYHHCGDCGPCFMRKTAFEINGQVDPVFSCVQAP